MKNPAVIAMTQIALALAMSVVAGVLCFVVLRPLAEWISGSPVWASACLIVSILATTGIVLRQLV
jgi:hypothetical protein